MSETRLNIELFKKIRERIATIPESYNQRSWITTNKKSPCGTAACLAGEAIICAAPSIETGITELRQLWEECETDIPEKAAELLGLEGDYWAHDGGETEIFNSIANRWPEPYRTQFL